MRQRRTPVLVLQTVVAALVLALTSLALATQVGPMQESETVFTDFATLHPPDSPNTWLIAPPDFSAAKADEPAPVFNAPAERLAQAWIEVVKARRRTKVLAQSADGLRIEAEQCSAVFGFVDRISARIVPIDRQRSTLLIYSRSQVGHWDLGVNRRRLRRWLADLKTRIHDGT